MKFIIAQEPLIYGMTCISNNCKYSDKDILQIPTNENIRLMLYGRNIDENTTIAFTPDGTKQNGCLRTKTTRAFIVELSSESYIATIRINKIYNNITYYLCVSLEISQKPETPVYVWYHQGTDNDVTINLTEKLIPIWLKIIFVTFLFLLSGLFSGLNLGLMSLSITDLQIFVEAGSERERKYAKIIRPIRNRGNFLLATLLLGNVLVNSTVTIILNELVGSGYIATIIATILIVIFGEIIPQAVTSKFALEIGAKTMFITKFFMLLTFPLSFPLSLILDFLLGKEVGVIYSREKLEQLIKEQQQMGAVVKAEADIITGALYLSIKTVKEIMTPFDKAFMIPSNALLNFRLLNQIVCHGYSRVPVYEPSNRQNIIAVMNIKDLTMVDPDDNVPVAKICEIYKRPVIKVPGETKLRNILDEFKKGKAHLAFVESDSVIIGIVTLEDVLEEIIQAEIYDETDVYNEKGKRRTGVHNHDFSIFMNQSLTRRSLISPQLKVLTYQHLYAVVESFQNKYINFTVLKSLLNGTISYEHVYRPGEPNIIIKKNENVDFALLLVNGRVGVQATKENLYFETGPFTMFCETVLKKLNACFPNVDLEHNKLSDLTEKGRAECSYKPDYEVKAITNLLYIKFTIEHYLFAKYMSHKTPSPEIMDNLLNEFDDSEWIKSILLLKKKSSAGLFTKTNNSDNLVFYKNDIEVASNNSINKNNNCAVDDEDYIDCSKSNHLIEFLSKLFQRFQNNKLHHNYTELEPIKYGSISRYMDDDDDDTLWQSKSFSLLRQHHHQNNNNPSLLEDDSSNFDDESPLLRDDCDSSNFDYDSPIVIHNRNENCVLFRKNDSLSTSNNNESYFLKEDRDSPNNFDHDSSIMMHNRNENCVLFRKNDNNESFFLKEDGNSSIDFDDHSSSKW